MASAGSVPPEEQRRLRQILIAARTKNCIRKGIKIGEWLCFHPYVWDDAKDYPEYTKSRLQIMGWTFSVFVTYSYFISLLVQCIRISSLPEAQASTKAFLLFTVIHVFTPVVYQTTLIMAREQLSDYIKNFFTYCLNFEENYVRESARPSKISTMSGIFLTCGYYVIVLDVFLLIAYSLTRLDSPEQISSMIPGNLWVKVPVNILFCSYFYSCYGTLAVVVVFSLLGTLFAFFDVIYDLGKDQSKLTTRRFQRPRDRLQAYRALQLEANSIDRIYWFVIVVLQYDLMLMSAFGTYGAIRLDGLVGIVLGIIGLTAIILLVVFLSSFAEFYAGSSQALESLTRMTARSDLIANHVLRAWFRGSVKSLRIARIPVAAMYYIDKELVLDAVGIVSDGIFFLLINF